MPIRGSKVLAWRPTGVTDTLDSTNTGKGSMAALTNLIPDPTTRNVFVPRPAAIQQPNFSNAFGFAPVFLILGDIVYGMAAAGNGFDTPFIYNLDTQVLSVPSGVTINNVPVTQSLVGDWTPPTMDTVGAYILVTHPGFTGAANGFIGWFDLTTPSNPKWMSGTTAVNALANVPVAVKVFGGRAYYAVGNATEASDVDMPLTRTNANQVLTFGTSTPITALGGLTLNNVQGGVIQSLMVFKASSNIWQVTGDYSLETWATNTLNINTGTLAPSTVVPTPSGLAFVAPDGVRVIDFNSNIKHPLGEYGAGVANPFQQTQVPSRMCAAYNSQVLRIALRPEATSLQNTVEYWYHFGLNSWTGPHSLPTAFIAPWRNTFIASMVPGNGSTSPVGPE